jgi:hypothetical protein
VNERLCRRVVYLGRERCIAAAERGNGRILTLTAAGLQKLRKSKPAWVDAQAQARALLGPDGARDLKRIGDVTWDAELAAANRDAESVED